MTTDHLERVVPREEVRGAPAEARSRRAVAVLGVALALGVAGEALLGEEPWGIGVGIWVAALLLGAALLVRRFGVELRGEGRWLAVPAVLFATLLAWRASPSLAVLNLLAMLVALGLGAWRAHAGRLRVAEVVDYLRGLASTGARTAVGPVLLGLGEIRWSEVAARSRSGRAVAVLRGVVLAAPLLIVFGGLLSAADPVFERLLTDLVDLRSEALWSWLLVTVFLTWIAAGYLRQLVLPAEAGGAPRLGAGQSLALGAIEAGVVLALLDALLLAFVLVQFRYLFGGEELVQAVVGMSYAEYARRGFFELVAVAALLLPVLLGLDMLTHPGDARRTRGFRALAGVSIALMLVVIASAVQRMYLYQSAYGLTEQRLYATAFMGWLTVVFLWFALTVLRERRERFAWGALLAAWATILVLNLVNPDAWIARANLSRADAAERLDVAYLSELSTDAAPLLLGAVDDLGVPRACPLVLDLLREAGRAEGPWPTWNWGRARGAAAARARARVLEGLHCPERLAPGRRG